MARNNYSHLLLVDTTKIGHSIMSEVFFWIQKAGDNGYEVAQGMRQTPEADMGMVCGCCGNPAGEGVTIGCCARCKAIGYCGRECQRKHWKMGHKIDCARPDELKKCFED
jgi:MYND finger